VRSPRWRNVAGVEAAFTVEAVVAFMVEVEAAASAREAAGVASAQVAGHAEEGSRPVGHRLRGRLGDIRAPCHPRRPGSGLDYRRDQAEVFHLFMVGQQAAARGRPLHRWVALCQMDNGIPLAASGLDAAPWRLHHRLEILQARVGRPLAVLGPRPELTPPGVSPDRVAKFGKRLRWFVMPVLLAHRPTFAVICMVMGLSGILRDWAHRSCRGVVSDSANVEAAGTAASDGVSDSVGGPAGDLAGDSAGPGSAIGIGGQPGLIRFGVGPDTITIATRRSSGPMIRTTTVPILRRPKTIRIAMPTRR
jgi:hypothetical protein